MPRKTPLSARKKSALHFMVEANDRCRYVTSILRRPKTNHRGEAWPVTEQDVDSMLRSINQAQKSLTNAAHYIEGLYGLVPKAGD